MEMMTESAAAVGELVMALEQATLMAKQVSTTTDPSHLLEIYSSLHSAHNHLSLFLTRHPQPTSFPIFPPLQMPLPAENSFSSAVGGGDDCGMDPMQVGEDEDDGNGAEQSSKISIEGVEERMRDCFIQNKRPKRPLSPSAAAAAAATEQRWRSYGNQAGGSGAEFDPLGTKLRSLDLIYQFHA